MPSPFHPRLSVQMLPLIQDRFRRCRLEPDLGRELADKAMASFDLYRGWEILYAFIQSRLPKGEYLLAIAGTPDAGMIAALQDPSSPIRIVGLIDSGGAAKAESVGCPVRTPEEAAQGDLHPVIVCSPALVKGLEDSGLQRQRIHDPTSMEDFRAFHDAMLRKEIFGALLASILAVRPRVEHVILVPNRDIWSVVDEESLVLALAPETTIRFYFGPPGKMDLSPHYPTFDVHQCLPLILRLLETLGPSSVYVRGSAQFKTEYLGAAVKACLPSLFMTFEVYDYVGMFDDVFLDAWGYSPELAEDNRNAEVFLGLQAEFTFDKTPGEDWECAARDLISSPRRSYSPTLGIQVEAPPLPARRPGPIRILCAGSMPHFHNYRPGLGFPHWAYQNIIDPIVILSKAAGIQVDIFNASHDPDLDHWPVFGEYTSLFEPGRVAYHARIPLAEIKAIAPSYDFGMFAFAASEVPIDFPLQQCLPNRCTSYISGDLPLIVNTEMRHLATLVETFQAGITIPSTEMEDLPRRIQEADLATMREGAANLHQHLVAQNREALETFRAVLSKHENRVRQL